MGELSKALVASLTFERPFSAVHSEVDLQIRELAESLGTDVAFILNLAILLLQGVGKCLVASHVSLVFNEIHGFITAGGCHRH